MAQEVKIDVDENFNLKQYLTNQNFKEYSKIEAAIENGDVTIEDILECNEKELKETLEGYNVTAIQRNRFVKAIKLLPESQMNKNNRDIVNVQNQQTVPILTTEEQKTIDTFGKISDFMAETIKKHENMKEKNKEELTRAIEKVK